MPASNPLPRTDRSEGYRPASGLTYPAWIGHRASAHGERIAVKFLDDDGGERSWSYGEVWRRACDLARRLPESGERFPRASLLFPPGIDFLAGFLGCQVAGWIPVPTCYPKPGREMPRLDSAAKDCQPSALVGDAETLEGLKDAKLSEPARRAPRVATAIEDPGDSWIDPDELSVDPQSLALLQYTSGSTSEPKGVMVRHCNLMANLEAIRRGFQIDWQVSAGPQSMWGAFWLPFFHDMGLVGGLLSPLYVGGGAVLMSPRGFLQRPIRWLRAIDRHRAVISGAPNFAYQLCVDRIPPDQTDELDLSCWRTAFCGAEPIAPRTLSDFASRFSSCGFDEAAFYPCYGLAEATLLAAGGDGPGVPTTVTVDRTALGRGRVEWAAERPPHRRLKLVSCGTPADATELVIVDPETRCAVEPGVVGEIWIRGDSVAAGYWNRAEETRERFDARLEGDGDGYCRTGDLGFSHEGEFYITGRRQDVVILRGRNHFPQDLEATLAEAVRQTVGQSETGQCAAFAVEGPRGEALAVVAELPRRAEASAFPDVVRAIRRALIDVHEIDPRHVLLVRPATVPLTSSGKVRRGRCREMFDTDEFRSKHRYDRVSGSEQVSIPLPELPTPPTRSDLSSLTASVERWISQWLVVRAGVPPEEVELEKPFAEYGLDSMTAVELSGELADWSGIELTPVVAWNYPTVGRISAFIAEQLVRGNDEGQAGETAGISELELEGLLDEIEQLPDDEIDHALADKRRS